VKVGDIVKKFGWSDNGMVGIILNININDDEHPLLSVLREDNRVVTWFGKVVEVISESR